ncbi:MAG: hypothetical protein LBS03_07475 [Bacteroidales bacterium]|nr:hypothetical protein [Bacteroidales bacterium]
MLCTACSTGHVIPENQAERLNTYLDSEHPYFSRMFSHDDVVETVQPVFTRTELFILDALVSRIDPEVCRTFDDKCRKWIKCWMDADTEMLVENPQFVLKCNESEYLDMIRYCEQQDESVVLLFFQLAVRAHCPYDQCLMRPVLDLMNRFPPYARYWETVNYGLFSEKPNLADRKCNETTIWYTRKVLESEYGYTYLNRLASLIDARRLMMIGK